MTSAHLWAHGSGHRALLQSHSWAAVMGAAGTTEGPPAPNSPFTDEQPQSGTGSNVLRSEPRSACPGKRVPEPPRTVLATPSEGHFAPSVTDSNLQSFPKITEKKVHGPDGQC